MLNYETLWNRKVALEAELTARDRMLSLEQSRLTSLQAMIETNRKDIVDFQAAILLCRACVQEQASSKAHIENVITSLLNGVLTGVHSYYNLPGEASVYKYALEQTEDDNGVITGFKPTLYKNGVPDDPSNYGGGVQNIIRLGGDMLHVLLNPTVSPVLILDEPGTNVSSKAWKFIVKFLEDLQKDFDNFQVITITHSGAQFPNTWYVWREGQTSFVRLDTTGD